MRMAKWVNNINKFQTLLPKLIANPANKEHTEVFRVLGDFGYVSATTCRISASTRCWA